MSKPLAIDLFTGLHGWADGLIAEGWEVVGFDLEDMSSKFGMPKPANFHLVLQDVLSLHGSQFKGAKLIVASPPCQFFSYTSMPWSKAKRLAEAVRADPARLEKELALFRACFRIQEEACRAAGHHIPLIVENVRGAKPWVGPARWMYGSFALYGDVPALMPQTFKGIKAPGMNWSDQTKRGQDFTRIAGKHAVDQAAGTKIGGDWFSDPQSTCRKHGSKSKGRKMASAMIAKIPLPLSRHIGATFRHEGT